MKQIPIKQILCILVLTLTIFLGETIWLNRWQQKVPDQLLVSRLSPIEQKVLEFIKKSSQTDSIVVDKEKHLLYYMKNGKAVKNDFWAGRFFSFPVAIAIGMGGRRETPEGEFYVETKNFWSRYTRFLGFFGAYGIHAGPTYLSRYYENMERQNPQGKYVTRKDDTRGCVATETAVMKYLFEKVGLKTPILIY